MKVYSPATKEVYEITKTEWREIAPGVQEKIYHLNNGQRLNPTELWTNYILVKG